MSFPSRRRVRKNRSPDIRPRRVPRCVYLADRGPLRSQLRPNLDEPSAPSAAQRATRESVVEGGLMAAQPYECYVR